VALGLDEQVDRHAEHVGVGGRPRAQDVLDLFRHLDSGLAVQHSLERRMDAGDRLIAWMTGGVPLERRQAVGDQVAKRQLEPGERNRL
jgi:hypothetical protein